MKRKIRLALTVLLALVFLGSMAYVIQRLLDYQGGAEDYSEAEELVHLPELTLNIPSVPQVQDQEDPAPDNTQQIMTETDYVKALEQIDLAPLQAENPDVLGWIIIPDTRISYPIVRGTDNDYYLNHTWKRIQRSVGSIFMDYRNSGTMDEFNTIVYGHRMSDSSMFHALLSYERQSFWEGHPTVYLVSGGVCRRYAVFSAYEAPASGETYRLTFSGDAEKQAFLDFCRERSVLDTGLVPGVESRILTLSTCTRMSSSSTRWVVHAVLLDEERPT